MSGQAPPYQQPPYGSQQPPYGGQQPPPYGQQQQYDGQGAGQLGQNPGFQQQPKLVLSPEEKAVMKECTDESFWYRSLPLSLASMVTTHLLVEKEILKPSLRYGSRPKVAIASFLGYFIGKFSYADICANKFLTQAPRSQISDAIRTRRGLPPLEPEPSNGADYAGLGVPQQESSPLQYGYQPEQGSEGGPLQPQQPSTNNYDDLRRRNREMSQVPNDGYRSSMPQVGEGQGSAYDDLRRRNREINQPPAPFQPQQQPPARPYPLYQPPQPRQGESKYGDDGFE